MKTRLFSAVVSAVVFFSYHPSFAGVADDYIITDGNSLSNVLRIIDRVSVSGQKEPTEREMRIVICGYAYIAGFLEACSAAKMLDENQRFKLPPEGIPGSQFVKVMQKYLNEHPQELHLPAGALCYIALFEGFPNPTYRKPKSED